MKVSLFCSLKVNPFEISLSRPSYCSCQHRHFYPPFYYYYYGIKLGYYYSLKPPNSNLVMVLQLRACTTAPDPKWILHSKNVPSCPTTQLGRKNSCNIFVKLVESCSRTMLDLHSHFFFHLQCPTNAIVYKCNDSYWQFTLIWFIDGNS